MIKGRSDGAVVTFLLRAQRARVRFPLEDFFESEFRGEEKELRGVASIEEENYTFTLSQSSCGGKTWVATSGRNLGKGNDKFHGDYRLQQQQGADGGQEQ